MSIQKINEQIAVLKDSLNHYDQLIDHLESVPCTPEQSVKTSRIKIKIFKARLMLRELQEKLNNN